MTQNSDATRLPDDRFELLDIAYEHTPWFRRRWFIGLTLLLFMPLTLCLVLSGDVYLKRQGLVYKMLPKQKRVITIMCFILMGIGLMRATLT
ncbi:hypothetical protein [Vibrio sp. TRT 17S01]|uniref:hypothetical protein n=1 Tax=Vibrio sp. TRT 17S01 TaxID=3418505 RepID=UPI003CF91292